MSVFFAHSIYPLSFHSPELSPNSNRAPKSKANSSEYPFPINKGSKSSPMPPQDPIKIVIIGAGISGLALAIGLLKHPHIQVTIYEAASAFEEIGAGIGLGRNAISAMKLIDPLIYEGVQKITTEKWEFFDYRWGMKDGFVNSTNGKEIKEDELLIKQSMPGTQNTKEDSAITVHRKDFLDVLAHLIPEGMVIFNKRAISISQPDGPGYDSKVEVAFQDATKVEADAVIGCDGIRSVVRGSAYGPVSKFTKPMFSGMYCYRGLVDMEPAKAVLGERVLERQLFLGRDGHVLTYPIQGGKTLNMVAIHTAQNGKWEFPTWTKRIPKEDMLKEYEDRAEVVIKILELFEDQVLQWALFDHVPSPTYFKGHICLLGDAAHAATPHGGAGAGQALEDAYILSKLLSYCDSPKSLTNAFAAYDAVRVPRTTKVIELSRARGSLMALQNKDVFSCMKVDLGRIEAALNGELGMNWLWEIDLEEELEKARAIFLGSESVERKAVF